LLAAPAAAVLPLGAGRLLAPDALAADALSPEADRGLLASGALLAAATLLLAAGRLPGGSFRFNGLSAVCAHAAVVSRVASRKGKNLWMYMNAPGCHVFNAP
jgi:hypothetical protein